MHRARGMAATHVPSWLLRPLPANAVLDAALLERVEALTARLPHSLPQLHKLLKEYRAYREYDAAANRAALAVWDARQRILDMPELRVHLLDFAEHLPEPGRARVFRWLSKVPSPRLRRRLHLLLKRRPI